MEEAVRGGWLPSLPDARDYELPTEALLSAGAAPAEAFDLSPLAAPPVRNQGPRSSCTGYAVSTAVSALRRLDADEHSTIYSALWTYYKARELAAEPFVKFGYMTDWAKQDTGAYLRDAVKVAQKHGMIPASKWQDDPSRFHEEPIPSAMKEARRWRLGPYYACNTLDDIIVALASKYPVVGAFTVHENFFSAVKGVVPMPTGKVVYGHAVCFLGYDRTKRLLKFQNSWGPGWGDGGYYYLPFDYAEQKLLRDVFALTMEDPLTRQDRPL